MSSLMDKLTGKAPLREDGGAAETETKTEKASRKKGKQRASNMAERKKDYSHLIVILKWFIPIAVCIALVIGSQFADGIINNANRAAIAQKTEEHNRNVNTIQSKTQGIKDAEKQQQEDANRMVKASDVNTEDDAVAVAVLAHFMTWSSGEDYESLRMEAARAFGTGSDIMMCLFPEQWDYYDDEVKQRVYYIDKEKLNLEFDKLVSYRNGSSSDSGSVSYSGIVTANRKVSASRTKQLTFYVEYTVSSHTTFVLENIYAIDSMEVF